MEADISAMSSLSLSLSITTSGIR